MKKAFWDGLAKAVLQSTPWASQYAFAETVLEEILPDLTKKLEEHFNSPDRQITEQVNTLLPASYQAQYRDYIYTAAVTCFQNLSPQKLINSASYVPETIASDETSYYLEQEQVEEDYENVTKTYLPKILAPVIYNFQLDLQSDSAFMHQLIVSFSGRLTDIDERLKKVEQEQELTRTERREKTPSVQECAQVYKDVWTSRPFLEKGKKNQPKKQLKAFCKIHDEVNVKALLQRTLDTDDPYERVLVILGEPGIGKSTIISYLLHKCTIDWLHRPVRVYRLKEFKNVSVESSPQTLLNQMGLNESDLNHSILILDGLDEMTLQGDYVQFLNKLQKSWGNNSTLQNFSLIITCRTSRIEDTNQLESAHHGLLPLKQEEIKSFAQAYLGRCPENLTDCLDKNQDLSNVLGIPLVLYMVLALDIPFKEVTSLAQIYDMLFTPEGKHSIYLRNRYDEDHKLTKALAPQIHEFSKQAAVKMWETAPDDAILKQEEYHILADQLLKNTPYKEDDLFIGQYFELGTDDEQKILYFVHRSMYEYFVALSIYDAIKDIADSRLSPDALYSEMVPGKPCMLTPLAELISIRYFPAFLEIKSYLLHLLHSRKALIQNSPTFFDAPKMVHLFVEKGLADAIIHRPHGGERGTQEEANRFWNLIWICREMMILQEKNPPYDLLPEKFHNPKFRSCLLCIPMEVSLDCHHMNFNTANMASYRSTLSNFRHAYLIGIHLNVACLIGVDLSYAHLTNAHLCYIHLGGSILINADLTGADLTGADLTGTILAGADLTGVHLNGAHIDDAYFTNADLTGAHLNDTDFTDADLTHCILPDGELYEDALKKYGTQENVLRRFTHPDEQP